MALITTRNEFLSQIDRNSNITLGVVIGLAIGSVVLSLVVTTIITRPLKRTTLCLNYISRLDLKRARETESQHSVIFNLGSSFNVYSFYLKSIH